MTLAPWRKVIKVSGYFEGRGGVLGPDTSRRTRWWELDLECGHGAERTVRYSPRRDGYARQRGGTQHRSARDALPAPKRVRCTACRRIAYMPLPIEGRELVTPPRSVDFKGQG